MNAEQLYEKAEEWATATTSARCAHMRTEACRKCTKAAMGECDYRSRREAYIQGAKDFADKTAEPWAES